MRDNRYRPSLLDHVPRTKRGHGTTHPHDRLDKDGRIVRRACRCVEVTCANNLQLRRTGGKRGDAHEDQKANANDWKDEHGFNERIPFEQCFA